MNSIDNNIIFSEKQKFNQWWTLGVLLLVNGLFFYGVYRMLSDSRPGSSSLEEPGLFIAALVILLVTVLILSFRMDTIIKKDGIYVRCFPFHIKFRYYAWNTIAKSYIRKYSALAEFGGWGIRWSLFGKGTAYNVSGDKGLQLQFMNNKKLLIGTNKPEELTEALLRLGQLKE